MDHPLHVLIAMGIAGLLLSGCLHSPRSDSQRMAPQAIQGVLDLTEWDFERDGVVTLSGEWEFYWHQLLTPADFDDPMPPTPTGLITVPGAWNRHTVDNVPLPVTGYASYRLQIILPPQTPPTALYVRDMDTAYILYVNGQRVGANGIVGMTQETSIPQWKTDLHGFTAHDPPRQILFQVSNFHYRNGGLTVPIQIGTYEQILAISHQNLAFDLFLAGTILIMACYHLGLFVLRPGDRSPLYFSIVCFAAVLRLLTTGEFFLLQIVPTLSWQVMIRSSFISVYLILLFFIMFISTLYPQETPRILRFISWVVNLLFIALALILPTRIYTDVSRIHEAFLVISCTWVIYVLVQAWRHQREGVLIFLAGFLVLFISGVNDVLRANGVIQTEYLGPSGLFIFIFSQSFLLSMRFARAFAAVEHLSLDLEIKNRQLLQAMQSQHALIAIQQELAVARQIQQNLLPPPSPAWSALQVICYSAPAREVGGDFYSYHAFPATLCHHYAVMVGDVSGKGISAALLMAASLAQFQATLMLDLTPTERMAYLDRAILPYTSSHRQNCAMCYVELCLPNDNKTAVTVQLQAVNAGAVIPYVLRNGTMTSLDIGGFALGHGLGSAHGYQMGRVTLSQGDLVVLITDGVVEARNDAGEMFGFERFEQALQSAPVYKAAAVLAHVQATLTEFVRGAEQHDDITIVVVQI